MGEGEGKGEGEGEGEGVGEGVGEGQSFRWGVFSSEFGENSAKPSVKSP